MRFLTGIIFGVLLTVAAAFFVDQNTLASGTEPHVTIVNWDVAAERLASSLDVVREQVSNLSQQ